MCRTSIYDARNNFSNLVKLAESGEPVELTRYDKPVAVIISYEEYENKKNITLVIILFIIVVILVLFYVLLKNLYL